ncbi:MAG: magnesium transporter [Candidatus Glassbacteria bacterium]|nr:magnesium transporter [Candidatus Glassbacteria bacterium]
MSTGSILCQAFLESHPADAARILERLSAKEAAALLRQFHLQDVAAPVLSQMDRASAAECLKNWPAEQVPGVLSSLDLHLASLLLLLMAPADRERLLALADKEVAKSLGMLLRYPEGTAGFLMDPQVLALPQDITVVEARNRMQQYARYLYYFIYVVNRAHMLVGYLEIRELLRASGKNLLSAVMHREAPRLPARAGRDAILAHPAWQQFHSLPVVDEKGTLLGTLHYQTLRRIESETSSGWPQGTLNTAIALGELYWIGTASMLRGLANAVTNQCKI